MIAEENLSNTSKPNISVSNANVLLNVNKLMIQTVPNFKNYVYSGFYKKRKLSEDDFTQIYIEQANILIRLYDYPFNVGGQHRDITNLSKGYSDIYFYPIEQNISTTSLFSVEAKRLPSPIKSREKEYVIGVKNNGGIERYKTEKHGKNLNKCGLLGFIEKEDCVHWLKEVNNWILDLTEINSDWKKDEILINKESAKSYSTFNSIAYKQDNTFVDLTHLWIVLN